MDVNNAVIKRGTQTSMFAAPLKVIFDGASTETLKDTEFDLSGDSEEIPLTLKDPIRIASTAAMFSKGAVFSNDAQLFLIKVVKTNYEALVRAKNSDYFWREVSRIMGEKEFYYDTGSCERKFKNAKQLYRDYVMQQRRTGEGPSFDVNASNRSWYWNEHMHFIMSKDDFVKPPMTVSLGSSNIVRMEEPRSSYDVNEEVPQIPRSRIPALKRPKSKKDVRAEALLKLADSVNRRTDVLLRQRQNNSSSSGFIEAEDEEEVMMGDCSNLRSPPL